MATKFFLTSSKKVIFFNGRPFTTPPPLLMARPLREELFFRQLYIGIYLQSLTIKSIFILTNKTIVSFLPDSLVSLSLQCSSCPLVATGGYILLYNIRIFSNSINREDTQRKLTYRML